jgi:hypothetical protein
MLASIYDFCTTHYILTLWVLYGVIGCIIGICDQAYTDGYVKLEHLYWIPVIIFFAPIATSVMAVVWLSEHKDMTLFRLKSGAHPRNTKPVTITPDAKDEDRRLDPNL